MDEISAGNDGGSIARQQQMYGTVMTTLDSKFNAYDNISVISLYVAMDSGASGIRISITESGAYGIST